MVQLNKYLREIGIDENYWLFKKNQNDSRYEPDEEGFIPAEYFNLNTTLAMIIYSFCFHNLIIAESIQNIFSSKSKTF